MLELKNQFDEIMNKINELPEAAQVALWRYMAIEINHKRYPERYESKKKTQCICGAKQFHMWYGRHSYQVWCPKCSRKGPQMTTELGAAKAWNAMIAKERSKENGH